MKQETYLKAFDINKQISQLKDYIQRYEKHKERDTKFKSWVLIASTEADEGTPYEFDMLLSAVMNEDDIINVLKNRLVELEKEFEEL